MPNTVLVHQDLYDQVVAWKSERNMPVTTTVQEPVAQQTWEPSGPFPFMKLPPELRNMVYKYHFRRPHYRIGQSSYGEKEDCDAKLAGRCITRNSTGAVPAYLLRASKTIYNEVMPLFFRDGTFSFEKIEDLGAFLARTGPCHRQHITSIEFDYEKVGATKIFDIHEAFRLLGQCPNLSKVSINIAAHQLWRKAAFPGLATLRKIRGVKDIKVYFDDAYWVTYLYGEELPATKQTVAKKFAVLKDPHSAAAIKRREANGITKRAEPRMIFVEKKAESRAERVVRREKLQEIV